LASSLTKYFDFWVELINRIDQYGFIFQGESHATRVVNKIFECCSEIVKENLSAFLKQKKYDLI
jgi:hypothetical protein